MVRHSKAFQNPAEQAQLREYYQTIGRGTIQPEPLGAKSCVGGMGAILKKPGANSVFGIDSLYKDLKIVLQRSSARK
jgi:hypothetical protein